MIFNICGQPYAGKKTLANYLKIAIKNNNPTKEIYILDSNILKKIIQNRDKSESGRRDNISQTYRIAEYLNSTEDFDVIIAITSPFKDLRDELKLTTNAIEIYVHTTNDRSQEGKQEKVLFEAPFLDYIDIATTDKEELDSANELLQKIKELLKTKIRK